MEFTCGCCKTIFEEIEVLENHLTKCQPGQSETEKKYFEVKYDQKSEGKSKTSPKRVKCPNEADRTKCSFSCSYCDKKFKFMAEFKRHEIIHTDEKPFSCDLCSETFKRKYKLKVHLIKLHQKTFDSKLLNQDFKLNADFKKEVDENKKSIGKSEIFEKTNLEMEIRYEENVAKSGEYNSDCGIPKNENSALSKDVKRLEVQTVFMYFMQRNIQ